MTFQVQTILLTVFVVLMAAAAFEDFRRLTIPNLVPAALCLLWPAHVVAGHPTLYGALGALGCALAVFAVGAVLFARGWLGGGDVKLLAAVALWHGVRLLPALLLWVALVGGGLGLLCLAMRRSGIGIFLASRGLETVALEDGAGIPYAVAIAGACGLLLPQLPFLTH
jgi:prepilin peptidase CpaA